MHTAIVFLGVDVWRCKVGRWKVSMHRSPGHPHWQPHVMRKNRMRKNRCTNYREIREVMES